MLMCVYACLLTYSEMTENNDTRDKREELRIFCYYKVLALPLKKYRVF